MILSVLVLSPSPSLSAQAHDPNVGAQLFATNCSGCHGADGRGGERAPNIATLRRIVGFSNADLLTIVNQGRPGTGMPSFRALGEQHVEDLVAHVRKLQGIGENTEKIAGDPSAGHGIFFGKGGCAKCHMISGEGGFMGPDLSTYGPGLSEAAIRRAIEFPDSHLQQIGSGVIVLQTKSGERMSGVVRSEDNFNLVVQTEDGRFHSLLKSQLETIDRSSHSLMPKDFGRRLSATDLQDLVSFLGGNGSSPAAVSHAQEQAGSGK